MKLRQKTAAPDPLTAGEITRGDVFLPEPSRPPGTGAAVTPAVADMRGQRRVEHLDGIEIEDLDAVEQALAAAEQDGCDVEDEFVDHAGAECLPNRRSAPGDVHASAVGGFQRLRVGGVEAFGDEVEGGPPSIRIGAWA
ncbi:hypothetical protein SHKM778_73050 [Streptomyces sp. KM77-8]|uniref:Uncharacterized protein n=1 Tax=Streptomyces haneummycinicus TaxID=3074435 RepID=A0AAT9HTI3_9ACTN